MVREYFWSFLLFLTAFSMTCYFEFETASKVILCDSFEILKKILSVNGKRIDEMALCDRKNVCKWSERIQWMFYSVRFESFEYVLDGVTFVNRWRWRRQQQFNSRNVFVSRLHFITSTQWNESKLLLGEFSFLSFSFSISWSNSKTACGIR